MSTVYDPMKAPISLHGLGFIQVQLQGGQRLHVWHPDLPRRKCFLHSAIHNHRFGFESHVLVGRQININYNAFSAKENAATHRLYLHEGARTANGGRPWTPNAEVVMVEESREVIDAGQIYRMLPYDFHRTEPGGDGRVVTLMTKTHEAQSGAMSSCSIGIEPDTDFDRFQLTPAQLWTYVLDVLGADRQVVGSIEHFAIENSNSLHLLPCPCCGGTADFVEIEPNGWVVACIERQCVGSGTIRYACGDDPRQPLAEQWNRRTATGSPAGLMSLAQEVKA